MDAFKKIILEIKEIIASKFIQNKQIITISNIKFQDKAVAIIDSNYVF